MSANQSDPHPESQIALSFLGHHLLASALSWVTILPLVSVPIPAASGEPTVLEGTSVRVRFQEVAPGGYEVSFDARSGDAWVPVAAYPSGEAWTVCSAWRDSWYADPHGVLPARVEALAGGKVRATAEATIGGQRWRFADVYSLEHGLVKILRTFEHLEEGGQPQITLLTRVRILGDATATPWQSRDLRFVVPGSLYNGNPSSIAPGPQLKVKPGALALYEEHRLPVPFVNAEFASCRGGEPGDRPADQRVHGSLLAIPSKVPQGHKGDDHSWSMGLEFGDGHVDLLSASGAVATNGKKSTIYGHRNGFDSYDDAYLDVHGRIAFTKTLYLDFGCGVRTGYSFRETLWKAYDVFRPTDTPHLSFAEAMALKIEYAKSTFYRDPQLAGVGPAGSAAGSAVENAGDSDGSTATRSVTTPAAGFCHWPWPNRHFQYGWCGGGEAIAYALLRHAAIIGDAQARRQAVDAITFYATGSQAGARGLAYGDFNAIEHRWVPTDFHLVGLGVSSRQLGEVIDRLADCVVLGGKMQADDEHPVPTEGWLNCVRRASDFLLVSPRYKGMFPRAWKPNGEALGWKGSEPEDAGRVSTAGVFCVGALAKAWRLTGEKKYHELAMESLQAYRNEFGADLARPPWGGTHDAGAEDKEAGWGLMHAALELHEATGEARYLEWARDAADWTLTWMYFHDVGFPSTSVLHGLVNTVGWTFISTQNQEIDVFGFWMAPDYYRLGRALGDKRYKDIGRVLFEASTQTIDRPGAMMNSGGVRGIQGEHYNHSNCTYVPGAPWRGSVHSIGIGWTTASGLYGGTKLAELAPEEFVLERMPGLRVVAPTSENTMVSWRYTFDKPTADWAAPDFDDSLWREGTGGFGEYGTPGGVVGTLWKTEGIWLRRKFEISGAMPVQPRLRIHHDDELAVYLNGVLALETTGYLTWYDVLPMTFEARAALKPGVNVLAVHCAQRGGGQYVDAGIVDLARSER